MDSWIFENGMEKLKWERVMSVEIGKWSGVLNTHSHTYHTHTANRIQGKRKKNINNYYVVVVVLQYTCPIRISKLSNFLFTQKNPPKRFKGLFDLYKTH